MPPPSSQEYNYTNSGIDNFLTRSIDQVTWQSTLEASINMPGSSTLSTMPSAPASNNLNLNQQQITGQTGNTVSSGAITLNNSGSLVATDTNGNVIIQAGVLNNV